MVMTVAMRTVEDIPRLLRLPEVSQLTGVPINTLRSWRQTGFGPRSSKLGKRVVYRESDVIAWIEGQLEPKAG